MSHATRTLAVAVALALSACSAPQKPDGPTVIHVVRTGDATWPYALDAHVRLCRSKLKPPAPGCDLATYGYRAATVTEAP